MTTIGVLGAGTWGMALARMLSNNGHSVTVWSAIGQEIDSMSETRRHQNLPGMEIPEAIHFTKDMEAACKDMDILLFAVPSPFVRATAKKAAPYVTDGQIIVDVAKGIEADTLFTMTQIIADELKNPAVKLVALSGPTHAEEVALDIPTGILAACEDKQLAEFVQDAFMSENLRVYTSSDPVGAELGAALKNVIALCAGICDGLGHGDNTKAMLMTRGLTEIARLGVAMGAHKDTFAGLTGVGDLIVTCTSMHSRNRRAGILIGQGKDVQTAMKEVGAVVEGYYAAKSAWALAQKMGVEMPITEAAYKVLYEGMSAAEMTHELLMRRKKAESEDAGWL